MTLYYLKAPLNTSTTHEELYFVSAPHLHHIYDLTFNTYGHVPLGLEGHPPPPPHKPLKWAIVVNLTYILL